MTHDSGASVKRCYGRHHACSKCLGGGDPGEVWSEIDGKCDYCGTECWCSGCTDGDVAS